MALLGINGAGKTTLFSLISRLFESRQGRIAIWGHDLHREPMPALAALGMVFQSRALDADLTVRQNLAYHAGLHGLSAADARDRTAVLAREMGLPDLLAARVATLSGGQTRRAEIARALLHRPRLLLLDEATAGLDLQARRDLIRLVRDMVASDGVGVLWATHLLDEIAPGDRVVVLHRGRVLVDATADELAGGARLEAAFFRLTGLSREDMP